MPTPAEIADAVEAAPGWNARVAIIRTVPETFGTAQHAIVYAAIADRVYVPTLQPDFAYIHTREEYELVPLTAAYDLAVEGTASFTRVTREHLAQTLLQSPSSLRVFRLLLGLTRSEFAETCTIVAERRHMSPVGKGRVDSIEEVRRVSPPEAATCAVSPDRLEGSSGY